MLLIIKLNMNLIGSLLTNVMLIMMEVFPHVKSGTVLWMLKDSIDFKPVHGLMLQTVLTHTVMIVNVKVL
jgi:hypothetical protein